jgi:dihydrofolate reductase
MIADDAVHEYFTRVLRNSDLLLFGRNTYQLMVPYWPDVAKNQSESEAENEFARVFDARQGRILHDIERRWGKQHENRAC